MSLDSKVLRRAKEVLAQRKRDAEALQLAHTEEAYRKNPRIKELDIQIRGTMADVIGFALSRGSDPESAIDDVREENLHLQEERVQELLAAGLPADYTDVKYACPKCSDTGYVGVAMCDCLKRAYREEQAKELSDLLKLGEETFDTFDLEWYDDIPVGSGGISPRDNMEMVYEMCREYARKFGKNSFNLFMHGGTGLGKTFLSACIAREVAEKGYSVVYETAGAIFSKFEEEKFSKAQDMEAAQSETRRCLTCDLLIIDDLGTELTTAFTVSALYEIINTRLITGKKTVINSNLPLAELGKRYSMQIMSRLEGEYQMLPFYGRDIRILKKERK